MKTSITFKSQSQTVKGKFFSSNEVSVPAPTILLLPGFPGNEEDVLGLGEALSHHGLNTLTFNYRGTYQSEGSYSLKNTQIDIGEALAFLQHMETITRYHVDPTRLLIGGWSYGGGMALIYTANHPEIRFTFSIAGTDHGEFAREYGRNKTFAGWADTIFEELKYPNGPVKFSGKAAIQAELIQNPEPYDLSAHISKLVDREILLIGGWDDSNVTIEDHILPAYRTLQKLGSSQVRIRAYQDNHTFEKSRTAIVTTILEWIGTIF